MSDASPSAAGGQSDDRREGSIQVELIRAWPRRFESVVLTLPAGATVAQALGLAGVSLVSSTGQVQPEKAQPEKVPPEKQMTGDAEVAVAVFGERVDSGYVLSAGDRIELLRPLLVDPKEARRKRAKTKPSPP
jgi:uncharacterized protein